MNAQAFEMGMHVRNKNLPGGHGCLLAAGGAAGAALYGWGVWAWSLLWGLSGLGLALFFVSINCAGCLVDQLMSKPEVVFLADGLAPDAHGARQWAASGCRSQCLARRCGGAFVWRRLLIMNCVSQPLPGDLADWFSGNSCQVVTAATWCNVILVRLPRVDTLGEISWWFANWQRWRLELLGAGNYGREAPRVFRSLALECCAG